jgi:soluble lytic murein transglycosylase
VKPRWLWLLVAIAVIDTAVFYRWRQQQGEQRYDRHIRQVARRYGVDPALVKAVIWRESRFKADARGKAGEMGLMQIRRPAAQEWAEAEHVLLFSLQNFFDPETNIRVGTWYLGKLLKRYQETDNAMAYALADYNAGRTHVLRWMQGAGKTKSSAFLSKMDFPGTQNYVLAVQERHAYYRQRFAAGGGER